MSLSRAITVCRAHCTSQCLRCSSLIHSLPHALCIPISLSPSMQFVKNKRETDENLLNMSLSLAKPMEVKCRYHGARVPRTQYDETAVWLPQIASKIENEWVSALHWAPNISIITFAVMLLACAVGPLRNLHGQFVVVRTPKQFRHFCSRYDGSSQTRSQSWVCVLLSAL